MQALMNCLVQVLAFVFVVNSSCITFLLDGPNSYRVSQNSQLLYFSIDYDPTPVVPEYLYNYKAGELIQTVWTIGQLYNSITR